MRAFASCDKLRIRSESSPIRRGGFHTRLLIRPYIEECLTKIDSGWK